MFFPSTSLVSDTTSMTMRAGPTIVTLVNVMRSVVPIAVTFRYSVEVSVTSCRTYGSLAASAGMAATTFPRYHSGRSRHSSPSVTPVSAQEQVHEAPTVGFRTGVTPLVAGTKHEAPTSLQVSSLQATTVIKVEPSAAPPSRT
jgi:hypothetical protein